MGKISGLLTKEWFEKYYFEDGLTMQQCVKLAGVSMSTLQRCMKKYDIQRVRSQHEAQTLEKDNTGEYRDREWFYQKYIVEKKSTTEIAKICKAGRTTIKRWLKKHGIKIRNSSEAHKGIKRSVESRRKQSESISGENNHFYGKSNTKEAIESMMDKKMFYPYQGGLIKWYRHTRADGKKLKLQGTWELETARFFDRLKEVYLVHGEFEGFEYYLGSKLKVYFPDLYLPKYGVYLEVKGFFNERMKQKLRLVREQNDINLEVWQEHDLLELGILPKRYKYLVAEGYYEDFLVKPYQH